MKMNSYDLCDNDMFSKLLKIYALIHNFVTDEKHTDGFDIIDLAI